MAWFSVSHQPFFPQAFCVKQKGCFASLFMAWFSVSPAPGVFSPKNLFIFIVVSCLVGV
jgi:hypothetical protein